MIGAMDFDVAVVCPSARVIRVIGGDFRMILRPTGDTNELDDDNLMSADRRGRAELLWPAFAVASLSVRMRAEMASA